MTAKQLPPPELLRQLLRYEPETGELFWRERENPENNNALNTWNKRWAGKKAFTTKTTRGYYHGVIEGKHYYAHRVIFAMLSGLREFKEIDHINGDISDNRGANLRVVPHAQNMKNVKLPLHNTSGFLGVSQEARTQKWAAAITVNGVKIHLGRFTRKSDAISARKAAEVKYGFHPNHGKR